MKEEFKLSKKMFRSQFLRDNLEYVHGLKTKNKSDFCFAEDIKEFIKMIEFWGEIHLGKDTLTISYSKFKELAGSDLIESKGGKSEK